MRIRRNVITLVLMMMSAAGALLAGATAMAPVDHQNTSSYASVHDLAIGSVITSGVRPDDYYDT
ncbi:hypothetical protein [Rugosimonospora africana]|uniref:Uncharacterized protein n=1 Tax=Rugosimonospora africana TaxID=556532 RepID=A0A8J3VRP9_9ACTN|nr:hypothetical protein [Rugosimonospora africana]GIH15716.1 hypothetical protein Raf01_38880 [Rugosimonospora africana]